MPSELYQNVIVKGQLFSGDEPNARFPFKGEIYNGTNWEIKHIEIFFNIYSKNNNGDTKKLLIKRKIKDHGFDLQPFTSSLFS